jgi:single-stranded DNA-binding protein
MFDCLVAGQLYRPPVERTSRTGAKFVTATLKAAMRNSERAAFVNVIAFSTTAKEALLALAAGDSAAMSGELTVTIYSRDDSEPRPQFDLVAHQVLTAYHVKRRRDAMQKQGTPQSEHEFDDDLSSIGGAA